jgi:hypothetical protein
MGKGGGRKEPAGHCLLVHLRLGYFHVLHSLWHDDMSTGYRDITWIPAVQD